MDGMSYSDLQVALLVDGDDVLDEELLTALQSLQAKGFLEKSERRYEITPDGERALSGTR